MGVNFRQFRLAAINEAIADTGAIKVVEAGGLSGATAIDILKGALDAAYDVINVQVASSSPRDLPRLIITAANAVQKGGSAVASSPDAGNSLGWAQRDVLIRVLVPTIYSNMLKLVKASNEDREQLLAFISQSIKQAQQKLQDLLR